MTLEAPPAASARPNQSHSGRRVVLFVLLALPLVIVPLLLSGRAHELQIDLVTLGQRERTVFTVGSFVLRGGEWRAIDEWPRYPFRRQLPVGLGSPPRSSPSRYWSLAETDGIPSEQWVTARRSIPFALIFPIENQRALPPWQEDALAVRVAAVSVLDPAEDADRACLHRLNELIAPMGETGRRARRGKHVSTPGEEQSAELLDQLLNLQGGDVRRAARELICRRASVTHVKYAP